MIGFLLLFFCFSKRIEKNIYTFDLTYTNDLDAQDAYEHVHAATAIAGLVNRDSPNLYMKYISIDSTWLTYLQSNWLNGSTFIPVTDISDLITQFSSFFNGAVIYDPDVYSSSMIASTLAGIENLIPICYRTDSSSLYEQFITTGVLKPQINLVGLFNGSITGSMKNDAYRWLLSRDDYMSKVNPAQAGYYLDYFWTTEPQKPYNMFTVSNQDFVIAQKGFLFDLFFWDDEAPNDDPDQPLGTDLKTVEMIFSQLNTMMLDSQSSSLIQVNGFTPWKFKYCDGKHGGVDSEWETVRILSSYNVFLDADACCIGSMTNAAFYQHYPIQERYLQSSEWAETTSLETFISKGYIDSETQKVKTDLFFSFYAGDYDSSAWLYSQFLGHWEDKERGTVPLGWAVNPSLSKRFPVMFDIMYSEAVAGFDYFTTGDSGAGYVNPTQYFTPRDPSNLPSGVDAWEAHNDLYFTRFDLSYTGFIIQGRSGRMTDAAEQLYTTFSYDGAVLQQNYQPSEKPMVHLQGNTPFFYEIDISGSAEDVATTIKNLRQSGQTQFFTFRGVLQDPNWYKSIVDDISQSDIHCITPIELGYLGRIYLGGNNNNRLNYLNDTIPKTTIAGKSYQVEVSLKNNGWNDLDTSQILIRIYSSEKLTVVGSLTCSSSSSSVPKSGGIGVFQGSVSFDVSGEYRYGLFDKNGTAFSTYGNVDWIFHVDVQ